MTAKDKTTEKTVAYEKYSDEMGAFFRKHKSEWTLHTSPMDEYDTYTKVYVFEDGAIWCERMSPETVKITVEVNKAFVDVKVKMLKTEFWSSETCSKYYYEQYEY